MYLLPDVSNCLTALLVLLLLCHKNHCYNFHPYCPHFSDFSGKILIFFILLFYYSTVFLNRYVYNLAAFFLLFKDHQFWPSDLHFFVCPHNEVPKKFVIVVFQYTLRDMVIPFISPFKPAFCSRQNPADCLIATLSCPLLNSFSTNFGRALTMWAMFSSFS